jgi:hypothetical protein
MVTDRIKIALQRMRATNVDYRSRAKEQTITPFAAALRAAQCHYCGRKPCVGTALDFKTFLCKTCSTEYYRVSQADINALPANLPPKELASRTRAILLATDRHMGTWVSELH